MCDYLLENQALVKDRVILELGSGLGLLTLFCARLGASCVIATDGDNAALEQLRNNVENSEHAKIIRIHQVFSVKIHLSHIN